MKILNLYAGVGGNRKLWTGCDVTAVERDEKIAAVYSKQYQDDQVVVADAHEYLRLNHENFDFIWSSPPCQSHTKMMKATRHKLNRYPDLKLYEEIIFLQNFYNGLWVVENVRPYYKPLIPPTETVGRHLFWASFTISASDIPRPKNFINRADKKGEAALKAWLGLSFSETIYYGGNHCPAQVLRNCVHPELGRQVFDSAKSARAF